VPRRKCAPSGGDAEREDWLRRGVTPRARQWALEEELLASISSESRRIAFSTLAAELAAEQVELTRLEEDLRKQTARIAGLEGRLAVLQGQTRGDPAPVERSPDKTVVSRPSAAAVERDYSLCRCEGFWVESPTGRVGIVEGLRFLSRIDRPDLLEVRAGLFGRQLLLIPVEQVEGVIFAEGRLLIRDAPRLRGDQLHELLDRLRKRPTHPNTVA
jgi:hypothetical protein